MKRDESADPAYARNPNNYNLRVLLMGPISGDTLAGMILLKLY